MNKIFFDSTIDKSEKDPQLFIIAPTWEVFGKQRIVLDGKPVKPHYRSRAKSSSFNSENGTDGLPGLPGGPGRHFFGVGEKFINAEYLEIQANGGKGRIGQDGENGKNFDCQLKMFQRVLKFCLFCDGACGRPGKELSSSFFKFDQDFDHMKKYLKDNPSH